MNKREDRVCEVCLKLKSVGEFYRIKNNPPLSQIFKKCKGCVIKRSREYYLKNSDRVKKRIMEYQQTNKGRQVTNASSKRMYKKYPEKFKARAKANHLVKMGRMVHLACEYCGNFLSEIHHPDYDKPLDIWWLCKKHHRLADKGELHLYG